MLTLFTSANGNEATTYEVTTVYEMRDSKLITGGRVETEIGFRCPRCKTVNAPLGHLESTMCPHCGLEMRHDGGILELTGG